MERIGDLAKYANEELILKIIPILDNIYLAFTHVPAELKDSNWIVGFIKIKDQLADFLSNQWEWEAFPRSHQDQIFAGLG
jgi:molecular chaperone GrpE (heat shock protein)